MAHPNADVRQSKVERSRVSHLTRGYASGGSVHHSAPAHKPKKHARKEMPEVEGEHSKHRMDRPHRAKGGRVKHKGGGRTVVNVITGHPGAGVAPPMGPPPGLAGAPPMAGPPMMPPHPPMAPPPGAGPGMPPPGPPMPMRAKGGRVNQGSPVYEEGKRAGTQVTHDLGKNTLKDMNRKRVVTFATGGGVVKFNAGGSVKGPQTPAGSNPEACPMPRASGGRVESPDGVAKATMMPGGGGGGEARLAKAHRAARK